MEQAKLAGPPPDQVEILSLHRQLQMRDQLVDQLSTELFRAFKAYPPALAPAAPSPAAPLRATPSIPAPLTPELPELEKQIEFYQRQIDKRDAENSRLRKSCQTLRERNHMLEQMIQDLTTVYRQKFSGRLAQVKAKVELLEQENRRLHAELQSMEDNTVAAHGRQLPTLQQWNGNG